MPRHVLLAVVLLVPGIVWGQELWDLPTTVRRTIDQHPLLQASRQRIQYARGGLVDAGRWPNPILVFSAENFPLGGNDEFQFSRDLEWFLFVSQTFETGGKKGHREAAGKMGVEAALLAHERLVLEVSHRVKVSFENAIAAEAKLRLARDSADRFRQLSELNRVRSVEGYIAEGDFIKTSLESQRFDYTVRQAALSFEQSKIALLQAMGRTDFQSDFELTAPPEPAAFDELELRAAALDRPEVRLAEARVARAAALLDLARAQAHPDVAASFGYKRNGADNTLYGGLSVPLPLLNRNQGGIASARAAHAGALAELEVQRSRALGELASALAAVRATKGQIENLERDFIERADESRVVSLAAYREGAADLLVVLEAERARNGAQALFVDALFAHRVARHELERASGVLTLPARWGVADDDGEEYP